MKKLDRHFLAVPLYTFALCIFINAKLTNKFPPSEYSNFWLKILYVSNNI